MEYEVRIDQFEGPMDLLLHFVKESKVNIWDINVEEIATQYLDYIQRMEELNLNIASEYLVMASELLEIKSRLLLPRNQGVEKEEEEEDPKEALVRRLIEYQRYKDLTKSLKEMEEIRQEIYTKVPENLTEFVDSNTVIQTDVTLDDLVHAFERFLIRQKEEAPIPTKVTNRELSVRDRKKDISHILKEKKRVSFFELFDVFTREYLVVTFLAILEMAKERELNIVQENNFDDIFCEVVA